MGIMIRKLTAGHAAGAEPRCGATSSNPGPLLGQFQQCQGRGGSAVGEWEGARDPVLASESRRGAEQTMRRQQSCNWI